MSIQTEGFGVARAIYYEFEYLDCTFFAKGMRYAYSGIEKRLDGFSDTAGFIKPVYKCTGVLWNGR